MATTKITNNTSAANVAKIIEEASSSAIILKADDQPPLKLPNKASRKKEMKEIKDLLVECRDMMIGVVDGSSKDDITQTVETKVQPVLPTPKRKKMSAKQKRNKEKKLELKRTQELADAKATILRDDQRTEKYVRNHDTISTEFQMLGFPDMSLLGKVDPELMNEIKRVNDNLESGVSVNHSVDTRTSEMLEKFTSSVEDVMGKIPDLKNISAQSIGHDVAFGATKSLTRTVLTGVAFGSMLYLMYSAYQHEENRTRNSCGALALAGCLFAMNAAPDFTKTEGEKLAEILNRVVKEYNNVPDPKKMEFQMDEGTVDSIQELVAMCLFGKIVGSAPEGKTLSVLFKELGSFDRAKTGLKSFSKTVTKFLEIVLNWIRVNILKLNSVTIVTSEIEEVRLWVERCVEVSDRAHNDDFVLNVPNGETIYQLWLDGNKLLHKYSAREHQELRVQVTNQMTYVNKIKTQFEQANITTAGSRQVPLCILIRGPSGVGKSATTTPLVIATTSGILPENQLTDFQQNYESFIYTRRAEQNFWDGYRGQFVCAIDDFGQVRDVAGQGESEFSEFIRMGNLFGYILHMADLESKGAVAFRSKIVLCTTNLKTIAPASIVEPEAVTRRFDGVYDQVPPKEYCTEASLLSGDLWDRRLDTNKVEPGFDERACEFHEYIFDKSSSGGGRYSGKILNFGQLVETMTAHYKKHERNAIQYRSKVNSTVDEYLQKRQLVDIEKWSNEAKAKFDAERLGKEFAPSADDPLHFQMDIDGFSKNPTALSRHTDKDPYSQVRDKSIKRLFEDLRLHENRHKSELMQSLYDLREYLNFTSFDEYDFLEQLIRGSKDTYGKIAKMYALVDFDRSKTLAAFEGMIISYLKMIHQSPELCAYVSNNLRVSWPETAHAAVKSFYECMKDWFRNYLEVVKQIYSKFPLLVKFCEYVPYGEIVLAALIPLVEGYLILGGFSIFLSCLLRIIGFFLPGIFVPFNKGEHQFTFDDRLLDIKNFARKWFAKRDPENLSWDSQKDNAMISTISWWENEIDRRLTEDEVDKLAKALEESWTEFQSETKVRSGTKTSTDFVGKVRDKSKAGKPVVTEHQLGSNDPVADQIATKVIENNSYEAWVTPTHKFGYITFIKGRIAAMPWHYITDAADKIDNDESLREAKVVLKKARSTIEVSVPFGIFLEAKRAEGFSTQDMCLVEMPIYIRNHIDITKYFYSEKTANARRDTHFALYLPCADRIREWHGKDYIPVTNQECGSSPENSITVRSGYRYQASTSKGDCGAIMVGLDSSSGREKIMGFHTGGNPLDGHGFATAVCYEDLMETLALFPSAVDVDMSCDVKIDFNADITVLDGRFITLGECERTVRANDKTSIRRSKLHGKWKPAITMPARLKPFTVNGCTIDPFEIALSKYCTPHKLICTNLMEYIGEYLYDDLNRASRIKVPKDILSFEEAIKGIQGEKDYGSIPRNTSAGFPHTVAIGKTSPGKTKWFGTENEYDLSGQACAELKLRCEILIADAKVNKRHLLVFSDYLKDERRPIEKVQMGSTRLFSACPLELTVVVRMYFGAWTLWMIKNKIDNSSAIGVNPYSFDWQTLAQKLRQFGKKVGAGDYSKFDGSQQPEMHWTVLSIIQKWYNDGEENARIRRIIWEELVNSRHIRGNKMYEWVSSLPSGFALTTLVNIIIGLMNLRYAWYRAHDNNLSSLIEFSKHVYPCKLGDDLIFNFSDECSRIFNEVTIGKYLLEIGFTYTNESKETGSLIEYRTLEECTFLKRSFRIEPILDRYVGPLALESLLESPYWTSDNNQKDIITRTTTETSLMELALHDKEIFDEWAPRIIEAYNEEYSVPLAHTSRSVLIRKSDTQLLEW